MSAEAYLVAERKGVDTDSFRLEEGVSRVLGRGEGSDYRVSGETYLSRRHATLTLRGGTLAVERVEGAANPIFLDGAELDRFTLSPDGFFVVGDTRFRFLLAGAPAIAADDARGAPALERSISTEELYALGAGSARMRLKDLLELPEMLRSAGSREALYLHVAGLVRLATGAAWACVLDAEGKILSRDAVSDRSEFQVSRTLLKKAVDESPRPTAYGWSGASGDATAVEGVDWAVCAAAKVSGDEALCFYAAGAGAAGGIEDNARFVGLVADIVGRAVSEDRLKSFQDRLERFFSGAVARKIVDSSGERDLDPKLAEATVLFFDIRGFSKRTEDKAEKIMQYMGELKRAFTEMTGIVLEHDGVVIDYIGDAILACWNLPYPDPDHIDRAVRAALAMKDRIGAATGGWGCGIGLHTGTVVAGAVGSEQVFTYSVMGTVVNQASRIEGITKLVETPVLITREIAENLSPEVAVPLRIGRFRPAGMEAALDLYEPMDPPGDASRLEAFANGLAFFEKGEFEACYEALDTRPASDKPARYLKRLAEDLRRDPPKSWDGVIQLEKK
jgi:adenylate cyclase